MSRRRRGGWMSRITHGLSTAWTTTLSVLLWPFYTLREIFDSMFGGTSNIRRSSWREIALDVLLFVPRWIGIFFVWLYHSLLRWPRIIRLRDLASGLPALLSAVAAVLFLFVFGREEGELVSSYLSGSNEAYKEAQTETDEEERIAKLKTAQFYSRALVKLKPEEPEYRFNVGYVYQELGQHARAQAIMDTLAPRHNNGFARAHLWQGDQLALAPDRPLTPDVLNDAEAHWKRALPTYPNPEEIHRRLGELNYFRYLRYNPRTRDPRVPSRDTYLAEAEYHLARVKDIDPKLALTLAEIRSLRGNKSEAFLDVEKVIADLRTRLESVPDDPDTRIRLAQAYRMTSQFDPAIQVLSEGSNLRPDVRYDQERSGVYYFKAMDIRRRRPSSLAEHFDTLNLAYLAFPANNYVAHRFIQGLTSRSSAEADAARSTLQSLVDQKAPGQLATFLLGVDCVRRTLPTKAEDYFRLLRGQKPDETPEIISGLAMAVLNKQLTSIDPSVAHLLFESAIRLWPTHPDVLTVRAVQNLRLGDYAKALGDLTKALEQRPRDAKLHEMLGTVYEKLGQGDRARQHRELADAVRSNASPPTK